MRPALPRTALLLGALLSTGCFQSSSAPDLRPYRASSGGWIVSPEQASDRFAAGALLLDVRDHGDRSPATILAGSRAAGWTDFSRTDDPLRGLLLDDDALLGERLRALGVSARRPVLVAGDPVNGWGEDGRIVWMLRTLGHADTALVDGGIAALAAAGWPTAKQHDPPPAAPGDFTVAPDPRWSIERDTLGALLERGLGETRLIDSRERREFDGATPYGERRGGHVPGARHVYYKDLLNSFGGLLPRETLLARLAEQEIAPQNPVVTYCTGGVRSGWFVVVLHDLGFADVRNYAGSMWEWSAGPPDRYPLQ